MCQKRVADEAGQRVSEKFPAWPPVILFALNLPWAMGWTTRLLRLENSSPYSSPALRDFLLVFGDGMGTELWRNAKAAGDAARFCWLQCCLTWKWRCAFLIRFSLSRYQFVQPIYPVSN